MSRDIVSDNGNDVSLSDDVVIFILQIKCVCVCTARIRMSVSSAFPASKASEKCVGTLFQET